MHLRTVAEDVAYVTASVAGCTTDAALACEGAYVQIANLLKRENLQIIHERIFGSLAVHRAVMDARRNLGRQSGTNEHGPVTYVQGRPVWGEGLSGVSIEAVRPWRSGDHWTVYEDGIPCGRGWKRGGARFLML